MTSNRPAFTERDFRKARASEPNKECVRVARGDGWVELRDDKVPFGGPDDQRLVFISTEFDAFLAGMRTGETVGLCIEMTRRADGMYAFRSTVPQPSGGQPELEFTEAEVRAFLDGVVGCEFDEATTLSFTAAA